MGKFPKSQSPWYWATQKLAAIELTYIKGEMTKGKPGNSYKFLNTHHTLIFYHKFCSFVLNFIAINTKFIDKYACKPVVLHLY